MVKNGEIIRMNGIDISEHQQNIIKKLAKEREEIKRYSITEYEDGIVEGYTRAIKAIWEEIEKKER